MKIPANAVFALGFLLLPLVLVMTLGGEKAEANVNAGSAQIVSLVSEK